MVHVETVELMPSVFLFLLTPPLRLDSWGRGLAPKTRRVIFFRNDQVPLVEKQSCHENKLIKTIPTTPHNPYDNPYGLSPALPKPLLGIRISLDNPRLAARKQKHLLGGENMTTRSMIY